MELGRLIMTVSIQLLSLKARRFILKNGVYVTCRQLFGLGWFGRIWRRQREKMSPNFT